MAYRHARVRVRPSPPLPRHAGRRAGPGSADSRAPQPARAGGHGRRRRRGVARRPAVSPSAGASTLPWSPRRASHRHPDVGAVAVRVVRRRRNHQRLGALAVRSAVQRRGASGGRPAARGGPPEVAATLRSLLLLDTECGRVVFRAHATGDGIVHPVTTSTICSASWRPRPTTRRTAVAGSASTRPSPCSTTRSPSLPAPEAGPAGAAAAGVCGAASGPAVARRVRRQDANIAVGVTPTPRASPAARARAYGSDRR